MDVGFPVAFHGMQGASLPGPLEFPRPSNTMSTRPPVSPEPDTPPADAKVTEVLNTLQILPDAINTRFFSQANIDGLQKRVQDEILKTKRVRIARQSDNDLVMIMRSIYMQNRVNNPTLEFLNDAVTRDAVQSIQSNLDLYSVYMNTEKRMTQVMDWGVNTSVRGTKTIY